MYEQKAAIDKRWAIVIGLGLALIPIHNEALTELTTVRGQAIFFLPAFGYVLLMIGTALFLYRHWQQVKETGLGDKRVWVPLLVIVAGMGVSGIVNGATIRSAMAPLFMGVAFFAVYVVARVLGEDILRMLAPFVVIGAVSTIVVGLVSPGQYTGGFITNYCASAGYLIFGAIVYRGKWRVAIMVVAAIGLFFIGALEAVFIVGVLGLVLLIRRDFSRQLWIGIGVVVVLVVVWASLGYLTLLYEGNDNLSTLHSLILGDVPLNGDTAISLTTGRTVAILEAVRNFSFVGHGYSLSTVGGGIVHNMPLIIMNQVGPFVALAWLFVTIFCVVKTGWKYAWMAVLAIGVWDHYLWTQMAPWWWVLVGVSTASGLESDLIFRKVVAQQQGGINV